MTHVYHLICQLIDKLGYTGIQAIAAVLLFGLAFTKLGWYPRRGAARLGRALAHWGRKPALGVPVIFLSALAVEGTYLAVRGIPTPMEHDEYSYMLAADTFAHGRLTNPTPPFWQHFESIHVIMQPTYMSKYPPGQGLAMGLGQALFGHAFFGVAISFAAACAAICWMMYGWMPTRWAFAGGFLTLPMLVMMSWGENYWGGAVAAFGGALFFGGVHRLADRPRVRDALLMGLGIAVLANSRPFEGVVVCAPTLLVLAIVLWRRREKFGIPPLLASACTLALVLLGTAVWMGMYNRAVTGSPWRMPYQVHAQQYDAAPAFLWQKIPNPLPVYRHKELQEFHVGWELKRFRDKFTLNGFLGSVATRAWIYFRFFIGPLLMIPLILTLGRTDPWLRLAWGLCILLFVALNFTQDLHPHYAAPVACLMMLLGMQGLRYLRTWHRKSNGAGRFVFAGTLLALWICVGANIFSAGSERPPPNDRSFVAAKLDQMGGRHLVIVSYGPKHDVHAESVYNDADIEHAPIVWARDMGRAENQKLIDHYADRTVWVWYPDSKGAELVPQNPAGSR